jgi:hypothetical protein
VQTCSQCNATSPDTATKCNHCQANLREHSITAVALKHFRENSRVKAVRVTAAADACSHCYGSMMTYPKEDVPSLPHMGCSAENGCRCFYELAY